MLKIENIIPPSADLITVSAFRNTRGVASDVTLSHFCAVVSGAAPNAHAAAIAQLRQLDKGADPERYRGIKSDLPCITVSCRCTPGHTHSSSSSKGHTGVLAVDIDGADNPQLAEIGWPTVRDLLGEFPGLYLCALSAGGQGLFMLLAVDPDKPHKAVFDEVAAVLRSRYRITADAQCSNLNRLRYLSHDTGAIVKTPLKRLTIAPNPPDNKSIIRSRESEIYPLTKRNRAIGDDERVLAAVRIWSRRRIPLDDYDDWMHFAAALQHTPSGAELFDEVSRHSAKYRREDCARKFAECSPLTRIGLGTFFERLSSVYGITARDISRELGKGRSKHPRIESLHLAPAPTPQTSQKGLPEDAAPDEVWRQMCRNNPFLPEFAAALQLTPDAVL